MHLSRPTAAARTPRLVAIRVSLGIADCYYVSMYTAPQCRKKLIARRNEGLLIFEKMIGIVGASN